MESRVRELPAKEGRCEGFGPREELVWHVLVGRLHAPVVHRRRGVQRVANVQCVPWLLDLFSLRWEGTRHNVLLLDSHHIALDLSINHPVDFALLTHLPHNLVLIRPLRILQRQVPLSLLPKNTNTKLNFQQIRSRFKYFDEQIFYKLFPEVTGRFDLQVRGTGGPRPGHRCVLPPTWCRSRHCLCGKRRAVPWQPLSLASMLACFFVSFFTYN